MSARIRSHLRSNVVGYLAVFLALTGSAVALPGRNRIDANDLRARVVAPIHIKRNAVRPWQLAPTAVRWFHLAPNSVGRWVRADYHNGDNLNITGTVAAQTIRTVTIFAPTAGKLLINGGINIDQTVEDQYSCDFLLNGSLLAASQRTSSTSSSTGGRDDGCETSDAADVGQGSHTVELRANGVSALNEIDDASLQVLFVPNG